MKTTRKSKRTAFILATLLPLTLLLCTGQVAHAATPDPASTIVIQKTKGLRLNSQGFSSASGRG